MNAIILDGKKLSTEIEEDLKKRTAILKDTLGFSPVLATILVGDDPSSEIYVNMKGKACSRVGLVSRKIHLPHSTTTQELIDTIKELNEDSTVFGILLQHPVPSHIDERACFDSISLSKDVDGVTSLGFGKMSMGETAFHSATPGGIIKLLDHYNIDITGKHAVVVGRSAILGKPMAMMLLNKNATVTICHSFSQDLEKLLKDADIVVGAVGKPEFIKSSWLKDGAIVIDAGYHPGRIGDIELTDADTRFSAYTPVPGGVGPMTISTLLSQTVEAAEKYISINN